jgi:hypothetical protein
MAKSKALDRVMDGDLVQITFGVSPSEYDALQAEVAEYKISRSEMLRMCVKLCLLLEYWQIVDIFNHVSARVEAKRTGKPIPKPYGI